MLAAGIVDGTAGRDGSGMFASRPDSRRFEGLPRSWRDAVLDQQIAAATRVTDNCDPPVGQKHLALVPSDPFGRRVWVRDPGILGVLAHAFSSPRSIGRGYIPPSCCLDTRSCSEVSQSDTADVRGHRQRDAPHHASDRQPSAATSACSLT